MTSHGESRRTAEYQAWRNMLDRCSKPSRKEWKNYGGRGIEVFPAWRSDFSEFLSYVGRRPSPSHSLDRYPNNDGNYEPGNVRWAERKQQNRNMRTCTWINYHGERRLLRELCEEHGLKSRTVFTRLQVGVPEEMLFAGLYKARAAQ
jgi:hypothetical protein